MKFLVDGQSARIHAFPPELVAGQLLTPRCRFRNWGGVFAIDNSAFSSFDANKFTALLAREAAAVLRCLFVAVPDVVGNARQTLLEFNLWAPRLRHWPLAFVAQDGVEDIDIPWGEVSAIFLGGTTGFKMSRTAIDLIQCGLAENKHVHIGRVNGSKRFMYFHEIGAHTCDGSSFTKFGDQKLRELTRGIAARQRPLFSALSEQSEQEEAISVPRGEGNRPTTTSFEEMMECPRLIP